jgi:hypothetical protein
VKGVHSSRKECVGQIDIDLEDKKRKREFTVEVQGVRNCSVEVKRLHSCSMERKYWRRLMQGVHWENTLSH